MSLWLILFWMIGGQAKELNRTQIDERLTSLSVPGAVLIAVNATDILYQDQFGFASFDPLKAMDIRQSIFTLASLSKTFLAVGTMKLVEENRLDLDEDVNAYLHSPYQRLYHPMYPNVSLTIRQLLSHSASINRNDQLEGLFVGLEDQPLDKHPLADVVYRYLFAQDLNSTWLPHPPGSVTLYSNIGPTVVAFLLEQIARMSYEDFIRERILRPIGIDLRTSAFRLSNLHDRADLVEHLTFNRSQLAHLQERYPQLRFEESNWLPSSSLDCQSEWIRISFYGTSFYPSNLLRMTGESLSKYLQMFLHEGKGLLQPSSIRTMKRVVQLDHVAADRIEYGLIWNWRRFRQKKYLGQWGTMPGMHHQLLIDDEANIGLILLSNVDLVFNSHSGSAISDGLIELCLSILEHLKKEKS